MADNDCNIIKPVESLQNIAGLVAPKRREERKRRRELYKEKGKQNKHEQTPPASGNDLGSETPEEDKGHSIDYCA